MYGRVHIGWRKQQKQQGIPTRVPSHVVPSVPIPVQEDAVEVPGAHPGRGLGDRENFPNSRYAFPRCRFKRLPAVPFFNVE